MPVALDRQHYIGREQTFVKHLVFAYYLESLSYKILSREDRLVFIDAFSGPWQRQGEKYEDTSFAIALSTFRSVKAKLIQMGRNPTFSCFFVEKTPQAYQELKMYASEHRDIDISVNLGEFEDNIEKAIAFAAQSFCFTFIDPIGWTGFAMDKIQPLLQLRGEVLINLMHNAINRFLDKPENRSYAAGLNQLFGDAYWNESYKQHLETEDSREQAFLKAYTERLRTRGNYKFATATRILWPNKERTYFYLAYATRHWQGLDVFRETERKVARIQDLVRQEIKIERQAERNKTYDLFAKPENPSLSYEEERKSAIQRGINNIEEMIKSGAPVPYRKILESTLETPLFSQKDIKDYLRNMRKEGKIIFLNLGPGEQIPKANKNHFVQMIP